MMSKIEIAGMKFFAYHGVFLQEKQVGNHFTVHLTLNAPLEKAVESDRLDDTVNYAAVYELVKKEMETPSDLLEHVAGRILKKLKKEFPILTAIEVKVTKHTPPFGGEVEAASVILAETYEEK